MSVRHRSQAGLGWARWLGSVGWMVVVPVLVASVQAAPRAVATIVISAAESSRDERGEYPRALLEAALERTVATHGPFRIEVGPRLPRERARVKMEHGDGPDVVAAATRVDWEATLIPVRVPIMKGLLGYRVLLVDGAAQPRFSRITRLDELRRLRAGGGDHWTITRVLEHHGFEVVTSPDYESLFAMLDAGRFDYFPRGIVEVGPELEARRHELPSLAIESSLLLYTPLPVYFFVTPTRPALARRLEEGLRPMVEDGSLEELLLTYYGASLATLAIDERRLFAIDNPELPADTPLDRPELWWTPASLFGSTPMARP